MATVSSVVLKHHRKQDGTWNVKVRVTHAGKSVYMDTTHFVNSKQLDTKLKLKKVWVEANMADVLTAYRDKIGRLGGRLRYMDANAVKDYLSARDDVPDFFGFAASFMERESGNGRQTMTLGSAVFSLRDFWGDKPLPMDMFTAKMLEGFERFLRTDREVVRRKRNGELYKIRAAGLSHNTIVNRMSSLRAIFNAARREYNDEDSGIILVRNYPFNKYRMNTMKATRKRNLSVDQLLAIRDSGELDGFRANMARDLFMLSFYLCGMNAKDMYVYLTDPDAVRMDYNRSKTKGERIDGAFISVGVPDEARPLMARWAGVIQRRYSDNLVLNAAIARGIRDLRGAVGIQDLTFYHARHSFATLARNVCGFSKDDVAMAMNHVDSSRRVTDVYLAPDWSIVDRVQSGVLELLK